MPEPKPRYSTRLWSQEVAIANAQAGFTPPRDEVVYEFSNRTFSERQPFYVTGTNTQAP